MNLMVGKQRLIAMAQRSAKNCNKHFVQSLLLAPLPTLRPCVKKC